MSTSLRDFLPSLRQAFARNGRTEDAPAREESPPRVAKNIFLLNPPLSGSTAMAALLLQSPVTWAPWPNGEGQWVPEVTEEMRRAPWNPDADLDWLRIRAAWLKLQPAGRSTMVEKSPPNLLRARAISNAFPDAVFVISNRDPYAWLGSILHRNPLRANLDDQQQRSEVIRTCVTRWMNRTRIQISNIQMLRGRSVTTTYELLCASTELFLQNLYNYCGDLKVDAQARLKIKDYPPQRLINMNSRQIALLTSADISLATEILATNQALLSFFGYKLFSETRS